MQKIIDFRSRPPFGSFVRDWIFRLDDVPGNPGLRTKYRNMGMDLPASLLRKSMDEFLKENERCGIVHSVVPLRVLPNLHNEDLVELLQTLPGRFTGFAGLRPVEDGLDKAMETVRTLVVDGPCTGIYMEPGLDPHPWLIDDESLFPLYELCQDHDVPLYILFGGVFHKNGAPDYDIYSPARIERLARAFPSLRILLSHACWPWTTHACAVAMNWENVWLSPDGFMIDHPGSQDYVTAANYRLQDKILFGSLYPSVPVEFAVKRYTALLRPEVREKIFYRNAVSFLKLEDDSARSRKDCSRSPHDGSTEKTRH